MVFPNVGRLGARMEYSSCFILPIIVHVSTGQIVFDDDCALISVRQIDVCQLKRLLK